MVNNQDHVLIQQASGGNQLAFRTLVEQHQGMVYSVCLRMLRTPMEAEDAVQEVFIKLWKNIERYNPANKLSTWLYRIASNHCLDKLKTKTLQQDADLRDVVGKNDSLDHLELSEAIEKLTEFLPAKQRLVFILATMEHRTIPEIAEDTGMSTGQVKSNLYYARKQIGALLNKYYAEKLKAG